jgi:translation initiation factor 2B subunit (eIF-2B alpha/beta/delta family)
MDKAAGLDPKIQGRISDMVKPIADDLLSGAAEIALRAITIFQSVLVNQENDLKSLELKKAALSYTALTLIDVQPAMAPLFHLGNDVLIAIEPASSEADLEERCNNALTKFEKMLCASAATIADIAYDLIDPGELIFAYSFSSTVVSCLLNARARGRFFRVVCTEARPSMEGRKLASRLTSGGIEVIHTFDNAMGLVLGNCSVAFMGCDCIARPGVVNKVGSWMLAVACRELNVPLYALSGTEKFITDDRMFEFERHERPGAEVWDSAPKGVALLNQQFDLVPFSLLSGLVTEKGILKEPDIEPYLSNFSVHKSLKLSPAELSSK